MIVQMNTTETLLDGKEITSEDDFAAALEETPEESERFFAYTRALKKAGEKEKPRSLLQRLAAVQKEKKLPSGRIETLMEIARAFPAKAASADEMAQAFRDAYPDHPALPALIAHYLKPRVNVLEAAEKLRRWVPFVPGSVYYFTGHGTGRVVDVNPAIEAVRFEFEGGKRLSLPPGAAARNLIPLRADDFRREKFEDPEALGRRSLEDPPAAVRHLINSVGRPLSAGEIKDFFADVVPGEKWASFWNAAKSHPQMVLSGRGRDAAFSWSASADAARGAVRAEFDAAGPERKLAIARQQIKRSGLAREFAERLSGEAVRLREKNPARALEILFFLEEGKSGVELPFTAREILAGASGPETARAIADSSARLKAYRILQEENPETWSRIYADLFLAEEDSRALAMLDAALAQGAPEAREAVAGKIFRSPRIAPRAFVWLCEKRTEMPQVAKFLDHRLLMNLLEALRQEEFSHYRAKLKTLFDRGGLAFDLAATIREEDEARRILVNLDRAPLELHRRDDLKQALGRRFEGLRGPRVEALYTTPEALAAHQRELDHLVREEIPKNGKAIQEAAQMGDLSENFEYHAARARAEFLTARATTLREEIRRARVLDPSTVNASEIRVGTRVKISAPAGAPRQITILGPWDSKPEEAIYSYQSEFAQRFLGMKPGEELEVDGETWKVTEIRPWR